MALTTSNEIQAAETRAPETTAPATTAPPTKSPFRAVFGWAAVAGAVAASGTLAVLVLTPDSGPTRIDTGHVVAEFGSVRAIEHRDELAALGPSRTVAEH